jgi:hypothetical protein
MENFIQQYERDVMGSLSGFDRLVLRGTLRALAVKNGMLNYLWNAGVLLKNFGKFVKEKSEELKAASLEEAKRLQRPILYLCSSKTSKEDLAREIAEKDGIQSGLICVLTAVEPCQSYEVFRNRAKKKLELEPRVRKCLFLYHYWMDPVFGFMNARIQSWFPFTIQACLNGREWLSRRMDEAGVRYDRSENCFVWIEDIEGAQRLMDEQLRTDWPAALDRIARGLNPAHEKMLAPFREGYYWSTHQSEWATDIMFRSPAALAKIYPALVRGGICAFASTDVMRFLGKKPHPNFQGEVVSHYGKRVEGIRLKHEYKANSVKVYDKQGSVLRVETTINNPRDFKVYRRKEGERSGPLSWQRMRKGVADLHRRAQISQASNERYLDALASIKTDRPVGEVVEAICRPARWKGQRVRAVHPWSAEDSALLAIVSRGEFAINGFRNRDIVGQLFPGKHPDLAKRRLSARVTYRLRLLRAHGLIRRIPRTFRYVLTPKGREITTAIIQVQHIPISRLTEVAA